MGLNNKKNPWHKKTASCIDDMEKFRPISLAMCFIANVYVCIHKYKAFDSTRVSTLYYEENETASKRGIAGMLKIKG